MCMLIVKPAASVITREMSDDMWSRNSDGFGIMYAENNILYTQKIVGSKDDVWELLNTHMSRDLIVHYRFNTHGDTDLTNAHPHLVLDESSGMPLWMAHNGVLSTGNAKDTSLSDTIHYIRDYIQPMLKGNPEFVHTPQFAELIGRHIGTSNKFAFMDAYGRTVVVNKSEFIEKDGMLFSNTYAIDANRFGIRRTYQGYTGYNGTWGSASRYGRYDDDDLWGTPATKTVHPQEAAAKEKAAKPKTKAAPKGKAAPSGNSFVSKDGKLKAVKTDTFTYDRNDPLTKSLDKLWAGAVQREIDAEIKLAKMSQDEVSDGVSFLKWVRFESNQVANALTLPRVVYAMRNSSLSDVIDLFDLWERGNFNDTEFCSLLTKPEDIAAAVERELKREAEQALKREQSEHDALDAALDETQANDSTALVVLQNVVKGVSNG